ncbi:unnamed protein product [Prorocentrum cordatum]|uniref:Tyr recombinase domain-containing protein n=1 Tax=Prorocentrum cordatum TaxID=2364126 RepID=A0ABN9XQD4_9DINO|nr:unnamed protein product [Polarella glacialis]
MGIQRISAMKLYPVFRHILVLNSYVSALLLLRLLLHHLRLLLHLPHVQFSLRARAPRSSEVFAGPGQPGRDGALQVLQPEAPESEPQRQKLWKSQLPMTISFSAGISACEKSGRWQQALALLSEIWKGKLEPNVIFSYSAGISACEAGGQWQRALALVSQMREAKLEPDVISYNAGISACESGKQWPWALALLSEMREAIGTWLGSSSSGCDCSCHFDASPDEALIGLLKGQLDRCGPEHLHGQPTFTPACPEPGHTRLELGLSLVLGLVLGAVLREALESLQVGTRVLAYYEQEDNYWHERILVGRITATRWVVVTPHFDIYEEDFADALQLCPVGPLGGLPTKLSGHILRMDMDRYKRNEARLLAEGKQLASEIRQEEGLPDEPFGALAPPPGPGGALAVRADAGDAPRWVALEARAGYRPGDELPAGTVPVAVLGDRGICELADGTKLAVASADTYEGTPTPRQERQAAEQDLRTLPVKYDAGGTRVRDFAEAVDIMSSNPQLDVPVLGPRTTLWLVQQFKRLGQTPLQRHMWWRQTQNLTAADAGVDEHQFLSELLEMGAEKDQLNEGELATFEAVSRRYQLWEEVYANRLREHEDATGSQAWLLGSRGRRFSNSQRGNISLPKIGAGKVALTEVLPADLQTKLETGRGLLRSPVEAAALIRDAGAPRAMDPKLGRLGYDYGHALGELYTSGVIEASSEPVLEEAGIFFVARKDKRLRLICDARTPNMHFTTPEHTALATGEALSSLEASGVTMIGMSSGDVDCCFYQYALPPWCRRYFNLPLIESRFLPPEVRGACGLTLKSGQVRFRFKVVPMGWSWAVHFIQEAHLHLVKSVLPSQPWCLDKCPGIDLNSADAKVLYIDNFAVLSQSSVRAATAVADMQAALAAKGAVSELDPAPAGRGELLGCELDLQTGCWHVLGRRLWRVYGALEHVLSGRAKVSGQELERLIGHLVSILMLRREGLAMLHSSCEFAQASYSKEQPLWKSVAREMGWVKALLPCLRADTRRPWSEVVTCFDAPPWGYGIVETEWDLEDVQRVGRVSERARFRGVLAAVGAPRERALEQEIARAPEPALLLAGRSAGFPEVDYGKMHARPWRVVGCGRWKRKDAIHGSRCQDMPRRAVVPALGGPGGRPDLAGRRARLGLSHSESDFDRRRRQLCPRQTRLAAAKVRPRTQELYLGMIFGLVRWLNMAFLPDWPRHTWGETLAEYAESIYDRGGSKASTQRLATALLWAEPALHRAGIREVFPLTHQTLKGWNVLEPSKSRPPVPFLVVRAVACWLCRAGKPLSGLAVLIMFETYMRPSEVLALRARQVVLPLPKEGGASIFLTFVVRASEYEIPTKTNEYDLSVPLDLPRQQWMVDPISFVQALRGPDDLFLGLGYNQLAEDFQSATSALGVSLLKATLYSLRHGGASHDRSTGARGLGAVQQRGGWKAFKSVLRYEKHGRLSLELRKLSDQQREALRAAGGDYVGVFNRSLALHFGAPHIRQECASKSSRDVGR